jgi:dihydroorotase
VTELIRHKAKLSGKARVLPLGAMTAGLDGEQLSEMAALKRAGCVAVSNGLRPIANTLVLRRALEYAATFGLTSFLSPEDPQLRDRGCAHEGRAAARLGLPGIPVAAETVAVARDLALAEQTGARIHFRGLSAAQSVRMIQRIDFHPELVSADVSAHQLHLCEIDLADFDSQCHVIPPLRSPGDRDALRQAVADGTIGAICSDHQPHEPDAKAAPFPSTAPGISGLETLLPLTLKLVAEGVLELPHALALLTSGPARILGLPLGSLQPGAVADVCIFDPRAHWVPNSETLVSRGHNSPFLGWELSGRVTHTLLQGRLVFRR